ncbi:MAG: hypothetical protein CR988_05230 [Treponema sp.]|nr:MAG: hypothetical protein CR988_05230 [Treponema sp.]
MKSDKLLKGYKSILQTFGIVIFTSGLCIGLAFLIVFPLWFLADNSPSVYTIVFSVFFAALFLFFIFKKMFKSFKKDSLSFFISVLKFLVIVLGLALAVFAVFTQHRFIAAVVLVLSFLIYGIVAFSLPSILKSKSAKQNE